MYCRKCGKWIDGDAQLCQDCQEDTKQNEEFFSAPKTAAPENSNTYTAPNPAPNPAPAQPQYVDTGSVMYGFGKALTSTILGIVGFIFACVSYAGIAVAGATSSWALYVVMTLFSVACTVIALVFGPMSIKAFVTQKNAGKKKPIPALVLGIVGVVWAAISVLYLFIGFIAVMAVV